MSTAAGISLDQYLSTHHEPECELIGGGLRPKPLGTREHSRIQVRLILALSKFEEQSSLEVGTEISFRHGDEVRVPDSALYRSDTKLYRGILNEPPLLCIEIVSPSQNPSELFAKCEAYHEWGVPYCWVIDPIKKLAWEYHSAAPLALVTEILTAGDVQVPLMELFA